MFILPSGLRNKRLEQSIVKHHSNGTKHLEKGATLVKTLISEDNPWTDDIRKDYLPLEREGQAILTNLTEAKAKPEPQIGEELKRLKKHAESYPGKAQKWVSLVKASARVEGVIGSPRQVVRNELVTSVSAPELNTVQQLEPNPSNLSSKSHQDLTTVVFRHPVKSITMDLVHAMNARVAPPASTVCCLREGLCHCVGQTNTPIGKAAEVPVVSSISDKEIQSVLTGIATTHVHDSTLPDTSGTSTKIMQEESVLCSAVPA